MGYRRRSGPGPCACHAGLDTCAALGTRPSRREVQPISRSKHVAITSLNRSELSVPTIASVAIRATDTAALAAVYRLHYPFELLKEWLACDRFRRSVSMRPPWLRPIGGDAWPTSRTSTTHDGAARQQSP
jgi:hypothetical protein